MPSSTQQSLNNLTTHYQSISTTLNSNTEPELEYINNHNDSTYPASIPHSHSDSPFTTEQITYACKSIKTKTALGSDQLHPLLLKHASPTLIKCITLLFNSLWVNHVIPSMWLESNIISLYKGILKGPKSSPSAYRPIALTSVLCRLFERLILPRLLSIIAPSFVPSQYGFRTGRCTQDAIATLQYYIEQTLNSHTSTNTPPLLPVAFLDLCNAFDIVDHTRLLHELAKLGVTGHLWAFIRSFDLVVAFALCMGNMFLIGFPPLLVFHKDQCLVLFSFLYS